MTNPRVLNYKTDSVSPDDVNIMRGSPYGNPYRIGRHGNREQCVDLYIKNVLPLLDLRPLRGKNLVCCCKPSLCHGDSLLEAANR